MSKKRRGIAPGLKALKVMESGVLAALEMVEQSIHEARSFAGGNFGGFGNRKGLVAELHRQLESARLQREMMLLGERTRTRERAAKRLGKDGGRSRIVCRKHSGMPLRICGCPPWPKQANTLAEKLWRADRSLTKRQLAERIRPHLDARVLYRNGPEALSVPTIMSAIKKRSFKQFPR